MSVLKRAKWIEGITQSNRILRDIAEIVTTAIQDEHGVVKAENWELVYPRPFKETEAGRSRLIKDTENAKLYIPVNDREETFRIPGTSAIPLKYTGVVPRTVEVLSEDKSTTYELDTDYTYNAELNTISRVDKGGINDGDVIRVKYATTYHQILESIPVVVERILLVKEPDRQISPNEYDIDYANKKIVFKNDPPTDAEYFSLTFTERTGTYTTEDQTMLKLEQSILDPTGRTFVVPPTNGHIMQYQDAREIAAATGGLAGTGEATYALDPLNKTVTFADAPVLDKDAGDTLRFVGYMFNADQSSYEAIDYLLAPVIGGDGTKFNIVGAFNRINDGQPHSIVLHTANVSPILYKRLSDLNAGYEVVPEKDYILDLEDPSIRFYEEQENDFLATFIARDEYNLTEGLSKVTDRIVLKTKTTPEYEFDQVIQNDYGAVDTDRSLTMYVEMTKPERLVNPETGLERFTNWKGIQNQTQKNNHYIMTRMFDQWNDTLQKPQETVYSAEDNSVIEKGAYISDWSKYSWFQDWKEYLVDELDDDPGSANVSDGLIYQEVTTEGMTDEFPIQFWITTNNNRIAMVLMGDPTLDQDNFLTSFGYFGRIHPFYDEECKVKRDEGGEILFDANNEPIIEQVRTYFENDVRGNFAMTVGASTLPALIGTPPKGQAVIEAVTVRTTGTGANIKTVPGDLYDYTSYSYLVTYLTEVGESKPTALDGGRIIVPKGTIDKSQVSKQGISIGLRFHLPDEATGYRVYRYHQANVAGFGADAERYEYYKLVTTVTNIDRDRTIDFVDDGIVLPMHSTKYDAQTDANTFVLIPNTTNAFYSKFISAVVSARSFEAVTRDRFTGAILDVKFSTKWGRETATGVSDITMFQTRSGLKYQKHYAAFITTEEFMRKEKSGQSRWTGKFHLSPVYIEHSYDKQRGWLDGVMAVDDSGIEHLDELIVDKDTHQEEVYKFFRVNAPYSMFNNSPNYAYGLAIIKSSMKWE